MHDRLHDVVLARHCMSDKGFHELPELRIGRANLRPVVRFLYGFLLRHLCEYL